MNELTPQHKKAKKDCHSCYWSTPEDGCYEPIGHITAIDIASGNCPGWRAKDEEEGTKLSQLKGIAPNITKGLSSEAYVRKDRGSDD